MVVFLMEWWYFLWNGGISYGMVVFLKLNEINNEIWGWGGEAIWD